MRICNIRTSQQNGMARLAADLVFESSEFGTLTPFFEVPEEFESYLDDSGYSFVAAGLMLAMKAGEPLVFDGEIEFAARRRLEQLQRIYNCWYPTLEVVPIEVRQISDETSPRRQNRRGVFFSCGIDSLHAAFRVKHADWYLRPDDACSLVVIEGVDLDAARAVDHVLRAAGEIAKEFGWDVLRVRTNIKREVLEKHTVWGRQSHGAGLAAIAHSVSEGLDAIHVGSSMITSELTPWGSTELTDPLWSTGGLEVVHVGADRSRLGKIEEMGAWDLWKRHARFCFGGPWDQVVNCGKCEKCVRTMLAMLACHRLNECSGLFPAGSGERLPTALSQVSTSVPFLLADYKEIGQRLNEQGGHRRIVRRIEKMIRTQESPLRAAARECDKRWFGGGISKTRSLLRRLARIK